MSLGLYALGSAVVGTALAARNQCTLSRMTGGLLIGVAALAYTTPAFADPDGDVLVFAATGLPPGLSIDPATGRVTGRIAASASAGGTYIVTITATDAAGNISPCSAAQTYVEDSRAPETTISDGPSGSTSELFPIFSFTSSQPGSTFECRFDSEPFAACSGPEASHTPALPLLPGLHTFEVRATDAALNTDPTPASRTFTVTP